MQPDLNLPVVVLIADLYEQDTSAQQIDRRRDLEMTDMATLDALTAAIESLGRKVCVYSGPEMLADRAKDHLSDIVLSIYGGQDSRNRMALVPAICETYGLRFIGPDVYGRIISQDKEVTKRLALDCGVLTPAWRVIRSPEDLNSSLNIDFPVVAKPLFEGSSIGISQRNLVESEADLHMLVLDLLTSFQQPVLVEQFIAGREAAYVKIEIADPDAWAFSEIVIEGDSSFFTHRLFDAEEKQNPTPGRGVRNIDTELHPEDRAAMERLLGAFGRYGYCRVDGRLKDGRFHFIELTPDAWISPRGQLARGFTEKGWTYPEVIAAILASAG